MTEQVVLVTPGVEAGVVVEEDAVPHKLVMTRQVRDWLQSRRRRRRTKRI